MSREVFDNFDDYINKAPLDTQEKLRELRNIIKETVPSATEKISWSMPTFFLNGNLVHFAIFKNHIGFYPGASGVSNFEKKLTQYKTSKGAIQFPLKDDLPISLIKEIVKFRIKENIENKK